MLGHIFLSQSAFRRLVQIRILGELRPEDEPTDLGGGRSGFLDGLELMNVEITAASPRGRWFEMNNLAGSLVKPLGIGFNYQPLLLKMNGQAFFVSESALQAASALQAGGRFGLPERIGVPFGVPPIEVDVFFTVSEQGVPTLNLHLATENAPALLRRLGNLTMPMPMDAAFADALIPGRTRVLNAGIAMAGPDVVMRFEFEPAESGVPANTRRAQEWFTLLFNQYPSQIRDGLDHWAVELPTGQLMAKAAKEIDENMGSGDVAKMFTSTQNAWGVWHSNEAAFTLHKHGVFDSLCSGLDVKAEFISRVHLSVPADNMLRQDIELEIDIDNWDAWKCIGVSLVNPISGLITIFDNSDVLPWWADTLVIFAPAALAIAMVNWGLGADDFVTKMAIEEAQKKVKKDKPQIVRTSLSSFYTVAPKAIQSTLTRNWLVLKDVAGVGDRLVMRGDFTAPDLKTLPRLVGTLVDPFEFWSEKNRCSSSPTLISTAVVDLQVEDSAGEPIARPVIPVRYGIDIEVVNGERREVGQATWRIVGPSAAEYQYPRARTTWTGIPGTFEVEVNGTYRQGDPRELIDPIVLAQRALRLRFFTSHGVREFKIPPPPPEPILTPEQAQARAIERVSSCYVYSTIFTRVKALQVFWLPRPPEDRRPGQHWQLMIRGLSEGRRLRAWDAETGEMLADVATLPALTEISLVVSPGQFVRALQLTLDETARMDLATYLRLASARTDDERDTQTPVLIRQTPLYPVARIELDEPAMTLEAYQSAERVNVLAHSAAAQVSIAFDIISPSRYVVQSLQTPRDTRRRDVTSSRRCAPAERGVIVEPLFDPKGTHAPGRYFVRPWYDRGDTAGRYFVRLSDDGVAVELFHRGLPRDAWPAVDDRDFPRNGFPAVTAV